MENLLYTTRNFTTRLLGTDFFFGVRECACRVSTGQGCRVNPCCSYSGVTNGQSHRHCCENSRHLFDCSFLKCFLLPGVIWIQGVGKPNPLDRLLTFFSTLKGIPGTQSNSTSLQHFLGLLSQCFIINHWLLKWTKFATFLLQLIFCELQQSPLSTARCETQLAGKQTLMFLWYRRAALPVRASSALCSLSCWNSVDGKAEQAPPWAGRADIHGKAPPWVIVLESAKY